MLAAATMYYVQDEKMETIAGQLGVSRSTVSRLLQRARQSGMVQVTISDPARHSSHISEAFRRMFSVTAHVVQVRDSASDVQRLDQVARVAGRLLSSHVTDNATIGVAWGTTVAAITNHLVPRPSAGITVVGLNGAANPVTSGIPYVGSIYSQFAEAFGGTVVHFPVPAFFDYASTKEAMWRERSIQHVLAIRRQCDVALFGVGGIDSPLQSHVYASSYLDERDFAKIRAEKVVGDVCTVLLREDGTFADISVNARATGLSPSELRRIPRRICAVAGVAKAAAVLGALRARAATDLVIDEATAKAVLDRT